MTTRGVDFYNFVPRDTISRHYLATLKNIYPALQCLKPRDGYCISRIIVVPERAIEQT